MALVPKRELARWRRFACLLWAAPNSLLGLLLGLVWWPAGGQAQWVDGVLELALAPEWELVRTQVLLGFDGESNCSQLHEQ